MGAQNSFVIVSDQDSHIRWLQNALSDNGEIVVADINGLDRILQIIDVTGAPIIFMDIDNEHLSQQTSLIEGLLTIKPLLSIVAMSRNSTPELMLAAMRAGARDFIVPDEDRSHVSNLVHRLKEHAPRMQQGRKPSKMVVLANARPDSDTVMLALHLALATQELAADQNTLLLDLGIPSGDALLYLGRKSSYTFADAVHSLRRLDETLIKSAFAEHSSGLRILDMGRNTSNLHDITPADIVVLLGTLRTYFPNIVVNLGGLPESEFLDVLIRHADQTVIVAEQSVPSVQQNMAMIKQIAARKLALEHMSLVVDRYYGKLFPSADVIAKGYGLPLLETLPPCGLLRLNVMNSGLSMFEIAPKEQYCARVRKLARKLFDEHGEVEDKKQSRGLTALWNRLTGRSINEV